MIGLLELLPTAIEALSPAGVPDLATALAVGGTTDGTIASGWNSPRCCWPSWLCRPSGREAGTSHWRSRPSCCSSGRRRDVRPCSRWSPRARWSSCCRVAAGGARHRGRVGRHLSRAPRRHEFPGVSWSRRGGGPARQRWRRGPRWRHRQGLVRAVDRPEPQLPALPRPRPAPWAATEDPLLGLGHGRHDIIEAARLVAKVRSDGMDWAFARQFMNDSNFTSLAIQFGGIAAAAFLAILFSRSREPASGRSGTRRRQPCSRRSSGSRSCRGRVRALVRDPPGLRDPLDQPLPGRDLRAGVGSTRTGRIAEAVGGPTRPLAGSPPTS